VFNFNCFYSVVIQLGAGRVTSALRGKIVNLEIESGEAVTIVQKIKRRKNIKRTQVQ